MNALVVIDMQNDFIDGAMGNAAAVAVVPHVAVKIAAYREMGAPIVFTRDTHGEDYLMTREGRNLPVVHCVKGTNGWQISSALDTSGAVVVDKTTYGCLSLPETIAALDGVSGIEMVGVCTDVCVLSNAIILKAAFPEWPLVVDASCCAGVTPQSHKNALEAMKMCQITVVNEGI